MTADNTENQKSDDKKEIHEEKVDLIKAVKSINPKVLEGVSQKKKAEIIQVFSQAAVSIQKSRSGPLPSPEDLAEYANIIPNGAERIMAMAEKEQNHRHDLNNTISRRELNQSSTGQWLGFFIVIFIAGMCGWLMFLGHSIAGMIGVVSALGTLLTVFILKKVEDKKKQ
ncbi:MULTISPECIES: DUF2335 domain-containing protein [Olivibacter]|uniref:DUF2335 domain-containing protein n=1 Tax=Olivibacter jilunii TaxID=985016 RepID=A0ABW6AYB4_9SPHI